MTVARAPTGTLADAFEAVHAVDAAIDRVAPERRSLDPDAMRARSLAEVARHNMTGNALLDRMLVEGLARLGQAQLDAFPGNLFWDFDAVAYSMRRQASCADAPDHFIDESIDLACRLMSIFGGESPIRFRYVHDFMYGFDWARWVARDPAEREAVGPFDRPFLRYILRRGHELLALIERNDPKYAPIEAGTHRNPFGFSRDPVDEQRLFEDLAARDLVPVKAWQPDGCPRWNQPYEKQRKLRARALGI